jgi:hypothetical protein
LAKLLKLCLVGSASTGAEEFVGCDRRQAAERHEARRRARRYRRANGRAGKVLAGTRAGDPKRVIGVVLEDRVDVRDARDNQVADCFAQGQRGAARRAMRQFTG